MHVDAEITVVCENVRAGFDWRALFYDQRTESHYSACGRTALEALAWCMDDYVRRGVLQLGPAMAHNGNAQPGDCLRSPQLQRPDRRARRPSPPPPPGPRLAQDDAASIERQIPTAPALRLHNEPAAAQAKGRMRKKKAG